MRLVQNIVFLHLLICSFYHFCLNTTHCAIVIITENRILNCTSKLVSSDNKNVRLAVSTVILNVSSHLKSTGKYGGDIPDLFIGVVGQILNSSLYETEAFVRTLIGFGTVLLVDDVFVQKSRALVGSNIQSIASQHGDTAAFVGAEIQSILG